MEAQMTITSWVFSSNRVQPSLQSPAAQTTAARLSAPASKDLASLHAHQASPQGIVERHVHELAVSTAALVQYAIAPSTRHLTANEANDIAAAAVRLRFVLRVLDGEVVP
jgi:hypothetical protein